jgi:MFS transporter, ACS family, tartrate transporter
VPEPDERIALQARIDHERKSREAIRHYKLGEALTNPRVLGLSFVYFGFLCGQYGLTYWLPQIVKSVATEIGLDELTGVSIDALTGYLVAVPYAFAIAAMIWWTRHSHITHERVWHVVCPLVVSGMSLIAAAYLGNPVLAAVALIICAMGIWAAVPTFWTLPTSFCSAAAGGIALINSIGNLGGFAGPHAIGWIKDATGETTLGLAVLAAGPIMAGVVTFLMGHDSKIEMAGSRVLGVDRCLSKWTAFRLEVSDQGTGRSYRQKVSQGESK